MLLQHRNSTLHVSNIIDFFNLMSHFRARLLTQAHIFIQSHTHTLTQTHTHTHSHTHTQTHTLMHTLTVCMRACVRAGKRSPQFYCALLSSPLFALWLWLLCKPGQADSRAIVTGCGLLRDDQRGATPPHSQGEHRETAGGRQGEGER